MASPPETLDIFKHKLCSPLTIQNEAGTRPKFYKKTAARTNPVRFWSSHLSSVPPPPWTKAEPSKLCNVCASLDLHRLLFSAKPNQLYGPMFGEELEHHASYADLITAAKEGCELCRAIWVSDRTEHVGHGYDVGEDRGVDYGLQDTKVWCSVNRDNTGDRLKFQQRRLEWYRCLRTSFEYFTYDSDPAASLVNGRPIGTNPWSDGRFNLMKSWIVNCRENHHDECSRLPEYGTNCMPTRLIDVGQGEEQPQPKLIEGKAENGEWVALSHCWGGQNHSTTTKDTLERHKKGMKLSDLGLTFQHAIAITWLLGYNYLWIDSLCIVQDSDGDEDWKAECANMASYYRQASLTLVADASPNNSSGMIFQCTSQPSQELLRMPLKIPDATNCGNLYLRHHVTREDQARHTSKRAWILQEEVLSPRKLHFGLEQIFWRCREAYYSETYRRLFEMSIPPRGADNFQLPPLFHFHDHHLRAKNWGVHDDMRNRWYTLVDNYAFRNLSRESDRLVALSGLAKEYSSLIKYTYGAGLWKEDLAKGLLWAMKSAGRRLNNDCPSWSWASLRCDSQFHGWLGPIGIYNSQLAFISQSQSHVDAEILDFRTLPSDSRNVFGAISWNCLRIRGASLEYEQLEKEKLPRPFWSRQGVWRQEEGKLTSPIECYPDENLSREYLNDSCPISDMIFFKIITSSPDNAPTLVFTLLLQKADEQAKLFRRVGMARMNWEESIANAGWQDRELHVV